MGAGLGVAALVLLIVLLRRRQQRTKRHLAEMDVAAVAPHDNTYTLNPLFRTASTSNSDDDGAPPPPLAPRQIFTEPQQPRVNPPAAADTNASTARPITTVPQLPPCPPPIAAAEAAAAPPLPSRRQTLNVPTASPTAGSSGGSAGHNVHFVIPFLEDDGDFAGFGEDETVTA
jgi:hypothetical protein